MREFQVMKQELQEMVHQRLDMSTELSDEAIGDVIDESDYGKKQKYVHELK